MTFEEPGIYEVSWETHDSWKKSLDHFFMLFYCEISKDHPDQCIVSKIIIHIYILYVCIKMGNVW